MSGCVYFVRPVGRDVVKVGVTSSMDATGRLAALQTASPDELELVRVLRPAPQAPFSYTQRLERELHRSFAAHRLRGEWFNLSAEIKAFIVRPHSWGVSICPWCLRGRPSPAGWVLVPDFDLVQERCPCDYRRRCMECGRGPKTGHEVWVPISRSVVGWCRHHVPAWASARSER